MVCPRLAVWAMKTIPRAKETASSTLRIMSWLLMLCVVSSCEDG